MPGPPTFIRAFRARQTLARNLRCFPICVMLIYQANSIKELVCQPDYVSNTYSVGQAIAPVRRSFNAGALAQVGGGDGNRTHVRITANIKRYMLSFP